MKTALMILQALVMLLFPLLILWLNKRVKLIRTLGPIIVCYAAGIIVAILSDLSYMQWDLRLINKTLSEDLTNFTVPLAIPLVLFSANIGKFFKLAGKTMLSYFFVIISTCIACAIGYIIFGDNVTGSRGISAMLSGMYIGGSPNLIAIGHGLKINESIIGLANTADMFIGGAYFLLLLGPLVPLIKKLLPKYKAAKLSTDIEQVQEVEDNPVKKKDIKNLALAVLLAVLCAGISVGLAVLITGELNVTIIMLGVTTLGVTASFIKPVRQIPGTYQAGKYAILIFSLALGMSVDLNKLLQSSLNVFGYVAFIMFAAIILQMVLCAIFRIDADTAIITSTAGIYSPAFVGPVADRLGNREVLVPGLICGLLGYAVSNYIGIGLYYLMGLFG